MTAADLLLQARQGLLMHRLRATMSSVGIVVGVGTVVASLAIGEGARRAAMADIGALGIDNVFVRAVVSADRPKALPKASELTLADAAAIQAGVAGVERVSVTRWTRAEVASDTTIAGALVAGVNVGWAQLANIQPARGRWLVDGDERAARRVAVVGAALARRIGSGTDPIGRSIALNGGIFRVVGVLEEAERGATAATLQTVNRDEALFVPIAAMDMRLGEGDTMDRVSEIGVHAARGADVSGVSAAIGVLLARRHPEARDRYELVVPRELLQARLRARRTFDVVLFVTGFIALIISGVGIMNVMLASVAEREQEIGVRRACGARRAEIVRQFATEAVLLCLAGGFIGIPLGVVFAWAVSLLAGWPVTVSVRDMAVAVALAASVGLAFGVYPAYLAASIDPIEALRA